MRPRAGRATLFLCSCASAGVSGARGGQGKATPWKAREHAVPLIWLPPCLQFVCVECLVTASVDMFPSQLRKSGRRELLILTIAVVCYLLGLFLVTEVSRGGWPKGSKVREPWGTLMTLLRAAPTPRQGGRDHAAEPTLLVSCLLVSGE